VIETHEHNAISKSGSDVIAPLEVLAGIALRFYHCSPEACHLQRPV